MRQLNFLFIATLFLVIFSASYAVTDIDVEGVHYDLFAYPGELVKMQIDIENDGTTDEMIYTEVKLVNGDIETFKAAPFVIRDGFDQTITLYFRAPEDEGAYDLQIHLFGSDDFYSRNKDFFVVGEEEGIQMAISTNRVGVKRGETGKFYVEIINGGNQIEEFDLVITGWDDLSYTVSDTTLEGGDKIKIPVEIHTDQSTLAGTYDLIVKVKGYFSDTEEKEEVALAVKTADKEETEVDSGLSETVIFETNSTYLYMDIKNMGDKGKIYRLEFDYPENWRGNILDNEFVVVGADDHIEKELEFRPGKEGNYTVGVILTTNEGLMWSKQFDMVVYPVGYSGITGAFVSVGKGLSAPFVIILVLIVLVVLFFVINYLLESEYFYFKFK
jgi:uncharacterized membrane protein